MRRILYCLLFFASAVSAAPVPQLKMADVRQAMDGMLGYHVEYKELSPLLVRRALKIYIEQADPDKTYLLAEEVKPYLDIQDSQAKAVIKGYLANDYTVFRSLNELIQKAIVRARVLRQQMEKELIVAPNEQTPPSGESFLGYAADVDQLKARIKKQLLRALWVEQKNSNAAKWSAAQREKVFVLWEGRFCRLENTYLSFDAQQKNLPPEQVNHYLAMHILKAMAKSLDAHTAYFSPEEAAEMRSSLERQFEGIGVILREGVDGVMIADLIKGGPAERCGKIAPGDFLIEIDGQSFVGKQYEEVLRALKGNKTIELGFKRVDAQGNETVFQVALKREKIVMQEDRVQYTFEPYADGIIGKVILPAFYESSGSSSCEKDLKEALRALKKQGTLHGLVLDMRENSGGFLNQAVKVGGLFISSGVIVISKYAKGEVQYLRDLDPHSYYNGPLIILTSKASASAAEIVAQALQDYGTALVVGDERTYGKGTIQFQTVTDDTASSYFKVTVGRYYTVSGRSTQIEGVKADIVVPTHYAPYYIGEKYLEYPLSNDQVPAAYVDPLTDVDQRSQQWFKHNYLPNIQKKLSIWTQMLPTLKQNSSCRLEQDKDFNLFLQSINATGASGKSSKNLAAKENFGAEDLQMNQAVQIVKDMIIIQSQQTALK